MRDPGLDTLLDLNGTRFVLDEAGIYWVKFDISACAVSPERPHGLRYCLTLHERSGRRLLGFDNAHGIRDRCGRGARTRIAYDHQHLGARVRFYDYKNASSLLQDFWTEVGKILRLKE
ncbi:hypothetical protein D9M69_458750 [compost metagenome]